MIGALTAPDRLALGLLDSRAAARYECDARPSTCTSHARACDGTIAHYRWWHSVACTECHRRESRMLACHTEPCEVRSGFCRRSQRRHVSGKYPGEMVASAPVWATQKSCRDSDPCRLAGGIAPQRSGERPVPTSRKSARRDQPLVTLMSHILAQRAAPQSPVRLRLMLRLRVLH